MSKKVTVDKRTVAELEKMSKELNKSMEEVLRMLTWMGRQALGREITIDEGKKSKLRVSFKKFNKMAPLDLKNENGN
jgi:hypothetical protein